MYHSNTSLWIFSLGTDGIALLVKVTPLLSTAVFSSFSPVFLVDLHFTKIKRNSSVISDQNVC